MARATGMIGTIEGYPGEESLGYGIEGGADIGAGPVGATGGGRFGVSLAADRFGKRTLIVFGLSALWLLLVWRAVEGY